MQHQFGCLGKSLQASHDHVSRPGWNFRAPLAKTSQGRLIYGWNHWWLSVCASVWIQSELPKTLTCSYPCFPGHMFWHADQLRSEWADPSLAHQSRCSAQGPQWQTKWALRWSRSYHSWRMRCLGTRLSSAPFDCTACNGCLRSSVRG